MIDNLQQTYNDFPYDSLAIKQTHPWHLHQLARACGLAPVPLVKAKVLELACASGGNLIPMAYHLPSTDFVGVDLAQRQIEQGQQFIKDLGLTNIELKHQSISDFQAKHSFDYIICHGLFSWANEEVREQIFAICQQSLSENGVAYISYNTFPGWHIGDIIRELLQFKTEKFPDPYQKIQQARQTITQLRQVLENDTSAYAQCLKNEIALLEQHSSNQLLHEHLAQYHYPLYVSEFVARAALHELQYLSDAFLSNDEGASSIETLQMLDIVKNRRFRCTLLCRQQDKRLSQPVWQDNFQLSFPQHLAVKMQPKPKICPLVRYLADKQEVVINHRHENVTLSPVAQTLIPYLDGNHDVASLTAILIEEVAQGDLILIDKKGEEITDGSLRHQHASQMCEETLQLLAKSALLEDTCHEFYS